MEKQKIISDSNHQCFFTRVKGCDSIFLYKNNVNFLKFRNNFLKSEEFLK